jgi:hypothetical protein
MMPRCPATVNGPVGSQPECLLVALAGQAPSGGCGGTSRGAMKEVCWALEVRACWLIETRLRGRLLLRLKHADERFDKLRIELRARMTPQLRQCLLMG